MLPLGGLRGKHAVQRGIWVPTQHLLWEQGKPRKTLIVTWFEVEVNLRTTVSRPVCPGVRRTSGTRDQFFFLLEISFRQWKTLIVTWLQLQLQFQFQLIYDRQSVGQSVLVSGAHLGPVTNFYFSLKFLLDS
jgi:hypothetical protein